MSESRTIGRGLCRLLALTAIGLFIGCETDMYDQPKYEPFEASQLFPDGQSARPPVPDTVARGMPIQVRPQASPYPITQAFLQQGQERFNIYCAPCHSLLGDGQGMVVQRGFPAPPSFHQPRLRKAPDSHFYDVITHGFGIMYSYAARVPPADRWAIIAYIRALQLSQHASLADVPEGLSIPESLPTKETAP